VRHSVAAALVGERYQPYSSDKLSFLYALSSRINEVAVIANRKGCGEVGLPPDYTDTLD
jgi:hypothetical protein